MINVIITILLTNGLDAYLIVATQATNVATISGARIQNKTNKQK